MKQIKELTKRIIPLMMASVMLFMAVPFGAMAAEPAEAEKEPQSYSVTIKPSEGGRISYLKDGEKISPEKDEEVTFYFGEGEDLEFAADVEDGYEYFGCRVYSEDGEMSDGYKPEDEIRFEMPGYSITIEASFVKTEAETTEEAETESPEETKPAETDAPEDTNMDATEETAEPEPASEETQEPAAFDEEIIAKLPREEETEEIISLEQVKVPVKANSAALTSVGDVFDFWSDPNWGEGDVLYYGSINGVTTPAYCIDHGNDRPSSYYTQINPVFYANQLGYVMKHGYPNEDWGLSGPEAQYLTQSAVYGIIGVDMWNISDGVQPPSYVYNVLWGNGNFSIATNLVEQAQKNATSADAAYVNFWYPTGHPSSQRLVTPLPYTPEGYLNIVKSTSKKTANIRLIKTSDYSDLYTLKDAEYGIYTDASCTQLAATMKTNAKGIAEYKGLDLKKYYVKEITPPEGYQLSDEVITYDLSTYSGNYALDAVYNVTGGGKTYTLTCGASTGKSNTLTLNEGTYTITEKTAPKGTIKNTGIQTVTVKPEQTTTVKTGIAVNAPEVYTMEKTVKENIIRGGFEFKKTINGEERVANCLFEVTMTTTGETHYIMTDPNGVYNSRKFEANNGNDEAVTKNEDGSYTIDESKLSYKNNVWFSMNSEGDTFDTIDGVDAFIYGEYIFKEIRTSANAGLNLIIFHGKVYEEGPGKEYGGTFYDLGTKDDKEITIGTTASDAEDGDKVVSKIGQVKLIDRVEYFNLTKGKEYTLEGKLFNKTTGAFVKDSEGNEITSFATFTAKKTDGTVDVEFVFDGVLLEEAKEIVVFESLYEGGTLLVVHNDPEDKDQTLEIEEPETPEPEKPETPEPEPPKHTPDAPKTGDASNLLLWMLIAGGAFIAATSVIIIFGRKKHDKRND